MQESRNSNLNLSEKVAKTIIKGAGFSFVGMALGWVAEYASRVLVARYLGVDGYGIINLAVAVISVVGAIALCGLEGGMARFLSYYLGRSELGKVKSSIATGADIVLSASVFFGVITFIFAEKIALGIFKQPQLVPVLRIFALSTPFFCFFSFYTSVFRGFKNIKYMVLSRVGFLLIVRLLFLLIFIAFGFKLLGISLVYCLSWVIASVASFFLLRTITEKYKEWKSLPVNPMKKELFSFSLPLMLSQVLARVRGKADTLLIGYFITVTQVGLYNVALPLAKILQFGLSSLNRIFMPSISELYSKGNIKELNDTYKRVAKWAFYVTTPTFLLLVFYSKYILSNLFGAEYQAARVPLVILSTGIFINVCSGSFGETLIAIGKTKINMLLTLGFVIINIALNIILIPKFSIIGAACAGALSLVVVCVAGLLYLHKQLGLQPFSLGHIKFFVASVLSFLSIHFLVKFVLPQMSFYLFPVFVIILYLLSFYGLFLFKGIDKVELVILRKVYQKILNKK